MTKPKDVILAEIEKSEAHSNRLKEELFAMHGIEDSHIHRSHRDMSDEWREMAGRINGLRDALLILECPDAWKIY